VARSEHALQTSPRELRIGSSPQIQDYGVDLVIVERADEQRTVHDHYAAIVRVVAIDAGDGKTLDAAPGRKIDRIAHTFVKLERETLRDKDAAAADRLRQRIGRRSRGDHRKVAEAARDVEAAAADGDDRVAVGPADTP